MALVLHGPARDRDWLSRPNVSLTRRDHRLPFFSVDGARWGREEQLAARAAERRQSVASDVFPVIAVAAAITSAPPAQLPKENE